jgi:hypothetical protein
VTEKVTTYTTVREVRYRPFYQLELVNRGGVLMLTLVMKKRPYFVERKVAKTVSATHVHGVARNSLDPTDVFEYDGVSYEIGGGDSDGPAVTYSRRSGWLLQPDAPSARQVHDFLGGVSVGVSVNYGTSTTSISANVGWDSGSKAGVTVGPVGVEAGFVYPAAPGLSGSVSYTNANEIGTYRDPAGERAAGHPVGGLIRLFRPVNGPSRDDRRPATGPLPFCS